MNRMELMQEIGKLVDQMETPEYVENNLSIAQNHGGILVEDRGTALVIYLNDSDPDVMEGFRERLSRFFKGTELSISKTKNQEDDLTPSPA